MKRKKIGTASGRKKSARRVPIQNLLLRTIRTMGVVSVALLAPKMTKVLKEFDQPIISRERLYRRIGQATTRLQQAGLITVRGTGKEKHISLTEQGSAEVEDIEFGEYQIPEPAFWDGKWRVLIFDLTEKRRHTRDQLRRMLQNTGFVRLQDSVWVYPFPCDEFIRLVRAYLRSGVDELRFLVVEALESDASLRSHFCL